MIYSFIADHHNHMPRQCHGNENKSTAMWKHKINKYHNEFCNYVKIDIHHIYNWPQHDVITLHYKANSTPMTQKQDKNMTCDNDVTNRQQWKLYCFHKYMTMTRQFHNNKLITPWIQQNITMTTINNTMTTIQQHNKNNTTTQLQQDNNKMKKEQQKN